MKHKRQRKNWIVFDPVSRKWWGPSKRGLYSDITDAGLYTREEAFDIQRMARKNMKWDKAINLEEYRVEIERLYHALMRRL